MVVRIKRDLSVAVLAERSRMSSRSFARHYSAVMGITPAKAVERLRIIAAGRLLRALSKRSFAQIAHECGFGCEKTFKRAFRRKWGVRPELWQEATAGRPDVTEDKEAWLIETVDTLDKRVLCMSVNLDRQVAFLLSELRVQLDRIERQVGGNPPLHQTTDEEGDGPPIEGS
jgi:AraC-like DNA-binding protein